MKPNRSLYFLIAIAAALLVCAVPLKTVSAGEGQPGVSDEYCLSCHNEPSTSTELPSGELLTLSVDRVTHRTSVHGRAGIACVQCHTETREFPHQGVTANSRREYTLQMNELCRRCHESNYEQTMDSTHQQAIDEGNLEAAVCTDCHGAHNVQEPGLPRSSTPKMCERCHSKIYDLYKGSVHGSALIGEGNPDVPTCTDCHGVHNLQGPMSDPGFHLFSPQICAQCHADKALMEKYGISTQVFETYISDFHGTTVTIFEQTAPDQETNKPVCIDCHGVHDMKEVNDPESHVMKGNLLETCQRCHPDATANFPDSWLGHYQPDLEKAPLVYFVKLFYAIVIPVTIGGMLIFVSVDAYHTIRGKRGGQQ